MAISGGYFQGGGVGGGFVFYDNMKDLCEIREVNFFKEGNSSQELMMTLSKRVSTAKIWHDIDR